MVQTGFTPGMFRLLAYTPLQYMLRAMDSGTAPAVCYADQEEEPSVCLILEGHSLFVGGDAQSPAAGEAMDFLARALFSPDCRQGLKVAKIVFPNEAWRERLKAALSDVAVYDDLRSLYRHPAPEGVSPAFGPEIRPITQSLQAIENFSMIQEEVCSTLGSVEKFLAQGFGYALVLNNRVCGFCTAEYISEGECAIGIAVEESFRKQGYAARMTRCFLRDCAARGLAVYWECWKNNIPSAKTAERTGFCKVADYPVLFVVF